MSCGACSTYCKVFKRTKFSCEATDTCTSSKQKKNYSEALNWISRHPQLGYGYCHSSCLEVQVTKHLTGEVISVKLPTAVWSKVGTPMRFPIFLFVTELNNFAKMFLKRPSKLLSWSGHRTALSTSGRFQCGQSEKFGHRRAWRQDSQLWKSINWERMCHILSRYFKCGQQSKEI